MTPLIPELPDPRQLTNRAIRDGFGDAILELGARYQSVWVVTADLAESMRVVPFAQQYPERFVEVGVAEQNLMGVAAGLALTGKTPFVTSFAVFSPGRNWDQLRVSVCYQNLNVKVIGGHAGLATGPDGATHQALEDIAITRVLPNMTVIVPADVVQARQATLALATHEGPCYLRLSREPSPVLFSPSSPFTIGKGQLIAPGDDLTIISTGPLLYEALLARELLSSQGVSAQIINMHTIKPFDTKILVDSVKHTRAVITLEDHQVVGGLGSVVAETLTDTVPAPLVRLGVQDSFGESGTTTELYQKHGLNKEAILRAARVVLSRKNR